MSGYSDDYKDHQHREWLNKWVPLEGFPKEVSLEQHRYILARMREAEHNLSELRKAIASARKVFGL